METVDLDKLNRDGFLILPQIISDDQLAEFERQMVKLAQAGLRRKNITGGAADQLTDLMQTGGDFRVRLFSNLKNLKIVQDMNNTVSVWLEKENFYKRTKIEVPLCYPSLRADLPGERKYLLPAHQDYATQCLRAWRLWIPLRCVNSKHGTMCIYPGTHKHGFIEQDTSICEYPSVPDAYIADVEPIDVELDAGHAVLMNPLTVHASVPARLDRIKYVLLVQVQDLTTLADESDPDDPLVQRLKVAQIRDQVRSKNDQY